MEKMLENLKDIFEHYTRVKLVYFFGSKARGDEGPLSDYDFAVYLDEKNAEQRFQIRLELISKLSKHLGTDKIDLCILNDIEAPELKYSIIFEGKLIYEREPFKVLIEPKIFNEYFDFIYGLRKYGLTKV
jgi:uncharacterized protein